MRPARRPVTVTDHCIVKYMELVEGLDVPALRAAIAGLAEQAINAGAAATVQDGCRYVLDPVARTVVTVTPPATRGLIPTRRIGGAL